jgi:hypothetical protein
MVNVQQFALLRSHVINLDNVCDAHSHTVNGFVVRRTVLPPSAVGLRL